MSHLLRILKKAETISKMIKDAVRTAIQLQKEAHDEAMQKLVVKIIERFRLLFVSDVRTVYENFVIYF